MALRRTLFQCLHNIPKSTPPPSPAAGRSPGNPLVGRLLHQNRASTTIPSSSRLSLPVGDRLIERLMSLNSGDRSRFDTNILPPPPPSGDKRKEERNGIVQISIEEARRVLWATQMEAVKERLRCVRESHMSYSDFVHICSGDSGFDHGVRIARSLDNSGSVIVLGDVVFLRPNEVVQAIEGLIPKSTRKSETERDELREMEKRKAAIDETATKMARRELWLGLGLVAIQTVGFMRLTFWELTWDVMEPVCFYVTSFYFMAGYAFFMRTSKDPSFEGFFQTRFEAKRRRLMKEANFDVTRFHQLRGDVHWSTLPPSTSPSSTTTSAVAFHTNY